MHTKPKPVYLYFKDINAGFPMANPCIQADGRRQTNNIFWTALEKQSDRIAGSKINIIDERLLW